VRERRRACVKDAYTQSEAEREERKRKSEREGKRE